LLDGLGDELQDLLGRLGLNQTRPASVKLQLFFADSLDGLADTGRKLSNFLSLLFKVDHFVLFGVRCSFHPDRDPDPDHDPDHDPDRDPDRDPDHDHDRDRDHDPDHDRDPAQSKPVLRIAALISGWSEWF
jgi:hypothetical protein